MPVSWDILSRWTVTWPEMMSYSILRPKFCMAITDFFVYLLAHESCSSMSFDENFPLTGNFESFAGFSTTKLFLYEREPTKFVL